MSRVSGDQKKYWGIFLPPLTRLLCDLYFEKPSGHFNVQKKYARSQTLMKIRFFHIQYNTQYCTSNMVPPRIREAYASPRSHES
jgi:hypothetical protein